MFGKEDYFENIFDAVDSSILILDENLRVLSANRSFFNNFKVDAKATIGVLLYDLGNGQWNIPRLRVLLEDILPKNTTVDNFEIEHDFTSIGKRSILLNARKIPQKNNDLPIIILVLVDITERRQAEERIRQMAYYDDLTGLPNRKLFSDRLGLALVQAQRNQTKVAVAMLDLDNFKDVNDTLGHDVGDLLLKAATERLSLALRKGDTVARFGGDEFLLILPDIKIIEDAIHVAQKVGEIFCESFLIDRHQLIVTASIGIAVYPDDGTNEVKLLKNADIAMYKAKQKGRARYQLYKKD